MQSDLMDVNISSPKPTLAITQVIIPKTLKSLVKTQFGNLIPTLVEHDTPLGQGAGIIKAKALIIMPGEASALDLRFEAGDRW